MKSDAQLQQDILRELQWDNRVKAPEIGVEVDTGIVTLTGTVSSYAKKTAALEAAHRVTGVRDVANDIQVILPGSPTITDTDIAAAIRNELRWNVFVPDDNITSSVSLGFVTLEGDVDTVAQRKEAELAIRNLEGVRGLTNLIKVRRRQVDPAFIRGAIEAALERRADREAGNISVLVDESSVTLTGRVHSWQEKEAVIGAAGHASGIENVVDRLRIDPNL